MQNLRHFAATRPATALAVIESMNQVLKPAAEECDASRPPVQDPELPLAPELLPVVAAVLG